MMYSTSLSARRAWIEIFLLVLIKLALQSLSARRAWIEIFLLVLIKLALHVALRKESVDRNPDHELKGTPEGGRSPQGERG